MLLVAKRRVYSLCVRGALGAHRLDFYQLRASPWSGGSFIELCFFSALSKRNRCRGLGNAFASSREFLLNWWPSAVPTFWVVLTITIAGYEDQFNLIATVISVLQSTKSRNLALATFQCQFVDIDEDLVYVLLNPTIDHAQKNLPISSLWVASSPELRVYEQWQC